MSIARDAIYAALLTRLQTQIGASAKTYTRRDLTFDQVSQDAQPAIAVVAVGDFTAIGQPPAMPAVHLLKAEVQVFVREVDGAPETSLLAIVDAIEAALERKATEAVNTPGAFYTTLGGLVRYARVAGEVEFYQGQKGRQAVALVPVEMLVAQ